MVLSASPEIYQAVEVEKASKAQAMSDTVIVIPARNEALVLGEVLQEIRKISMQVIVVDDASSDETSRVARENGAEVLSLVVQLGAWGATQTGLRYALRQGAQTVITLDADGQHEPAHIVDLLRPLHDGTADVVIGSCPMRVSVLRRLAWNYFRWLTRLSMDDLTSGFRAYNRRAMEILASREATLLDYQDVGVLMIMRAKGLRVSEVTVEIGLRRSGVSRVFHSWWVVMRYMIETTVLCLANVGGQTSVEERDPEAEQPERTP